MVKEIGVNGVVFGVLDKNNSIDEKNLNVLLKCCDNFDVIFYRVIDELNIIDSVKILKDYDKIMNILILGGKGSIVDNI